MAKAKTVSFEVPVTHKYVIFGGNSEALDDMVFLDGEYAFVGVEEAGMTCPKPIDIWVAYSGVSDAWRHIRAEQGISEEYTEVSWFPTPGSESYQTLMSGGGSALYAALMVLECDPEATIVFCGVGVSKADEEGWQYALPRLEGRAIGLSGFPQEFLG